jgi:hypothetical protein
MKLETVGNGVYLVPGEKILVNPRLLREVRVGKVFAENEHLGRAMEHVLRYSNKHGAWVGVEWHLVVKAIRSRENGTADATIQALRDAIANGLLAVPRKYKRWWSKWLNVFEPTLVCPTRGLASMVATYHTARVAGEGAFDGLMEALARRGL